MHFNALKNDNWLVLYIDQKGLKRKLQIKLQYLHAWNTFNMLPSRSSPFQLITQSGSSLLLQQLGLQPSQQVRHTFSNL